MMPLDLSMAPRAVASRSGPFYNAAVDLIERNLPTRAGKTAVIDCDGAHTYAEIAERADRFAGLLSGLGIEPEQRIVLALLDGVDFFACFLGAIKAGVVPIPLNTLFQPSDYAFILDDSRAKAAVVSPALFGAVGAAAVSASWNGRTIVTGGAPASPGALSFEREMEAASARTDAAPTRPDDACFWLYSSGSTGSPKGTVHIQTSLLETAELFAQGVLGFHESDVVYSAAKLFFAYGLGNALTFPMSVGATAVLLDARPTPAAVGAILRDRRPTIFCGVPTLFNSLLASTELPRREELALRLCTSAGESLPAEVGRSWAARTGVDIVDGIGSTEMLHIFVSNRPDNVRYGTTGVPVPGYRARIVDDAMLDVEAGEIGELIVSGPSAAAYYWNNRAKTRATFAGEWVRTGDKFRQDENGDYVHCGRVDDMLKVSGIWVSPTEVEGAIVSHEAVLEAAVIGAADEGDLIKPKAFIVVNAGYVGDAALAEALKIFVKERLAPYKYPRWIEFVDDLPKTATGKIQRHVLRKREAEARNR